jgi:hypothetical protein
MEENLLEVFCMGSQRKEGRKEGRKEEDSIVMHPFSRHRV